LLGALLAALVMAGCHSAVRQDVDALICHRVGSPVDPQPPSLLGPSASAASLEKPAAASPDEGDDLALLLAAAQEKKPGLPEVPFPQPKEPKIPLEKRLAVPPGVPGAEAPPIKLPSIKATPKEYDAAVKKYFPPLPPVGPEFEPRPGPNGLPLTLEDLQKLARAHSPLLREAASDVKGAEGMALQAGLYPNPTVGLQGQTQGPGGGPIYGGFVGQTIKTMGKLKLAQAAAAIDLENARLAYRKAETDLTASVRSAYFGVLVARENIRANRALVRLTDAVYDAMVQLLRGGEVAPYEPNQLGVFAAQARGALISARNAYGLAWKQLAATVGLGARLPPTELAGRIDMPIPVFNYDQVLAHVLSAHTDVRTAANGILKARYNLRSAEVTPIPDVNLQALIQEDASPPGPARPIATVTATLTLPVWDLNQGNVMQSQAALLRAVEEPHRVRNDLTGRVADAFKRYTESRLWIDLYRTEILPKQVQAFRATVLRHSQGELGAVSFNDLVTAEQNLVQVVGGYLTYLGLMWQAVVDVTNLLQTDDLFQVCERLPVAPIPDLEHLLQLPCCHPCSPLPEAALREPDLLWPQAAFRPASQPAPANVVPPAQPEVMRIELPVPAPAPQPAGRAALLPPPGLGSGGRNAAR
jgi:cobalt-zinc-cadmium efflux system outer membrane protein